MYQRNLANRETDRFSDFHNTLDFAGPPGDGSR